jgi:hypothetical protein
VLNGVGGRTIAEAKERMSYAEALGWYAYRKKTGPFNAASRVEWSLAQVCTLICAAAGLKKKGGGEFAITDFIPYAEEPELTIESAMKALGVHK